MIKATVKKIFIAQTQCIKLVSVVLPTFHCEVSNNKIPKQQPVYLFVEPL